MSSPILVGVTGKKRAGKDSVAARLVEAHGFARVAFADPLKDACLALDPLVYVEFDESGPLAAAMGFGIAPGKIYRLSYLIKHAGWEAAKEVREVRRTLQRYGVAIREQSPTYWLDAALAKVQAHFDEGVSVVIPDVRFNNELDAIQAHGYHVHVDRPGLVSEDTHASEVELEPRYGEAAYWVENYSTLDDLNDDVDLSLAIINDLEVEK